MESLIPILKVLLYVIIACYSLPLIVLFILFLGFGLFFIFGGILSLYIYLRS